MGQGETANGAGGDSEWGRGETVNGAGGRQRMGQGGDSEWGWAVAAVFLCHLPNPNVKQTNTRSNLKDFFFFSH